LLAALTLESVRGSPTWTSVASVPLLVGVFLFEVTLLVVSRASRNLPWWRASDDHFSLRLQAAGWSRRRTVALAWAAASALALAALSLHHLRGAAAVSVLGAAVGAIAVAWRRLGAKST
jgi:UDP-GlcNAc:undecaprenyl-phosphate GlcNAc-1-phosphate transferase